jgi:hypothetical protein
VAETEHHLRPRNELARFAKTKALAMRNANTGNPDAVQVSVRGQAADGRYIVRRDHWPMDILVPASPRDAVIPFPRRMPMGFEDGSPQKPVLYWLQRRVTAVASPLGLPAAVATFNWICHLADFRRSNSWTDTTFDYATAIAGTHPETGPFQFQRWGAEEAAAEPAQVSLWADAQDLTMDLVFADDPVAIDIETLYLNPPGEDPLDLTVTGWEILAVSLANDTDGGHPDAYVLARVDLDDGASTYSAYQIFRLEISETAGVGSVAEIWRHELSLVDDDFGLVLAGECDIVVTGGRVCVLLGALADSVIVAHVSQGTGSDRSDYTYAPGDAARAFEVLTDNRRDWRLFAAGGDSARLIVYAERQLFALDLDTNTLEWETLTTAPEYSLAPTHMFAGSILCGYEKQTLVAIEDLPLRVDAWDPVPLILDPRVENAEGLSLEAGVCAINLTTGAIINATPFPGTELSYEARHAYEDYYVDVDGYSWAIPDKRELGGGETEEDPEDFYRTGFSRAKHARFHQYFQFPETTLGTEAAWTTTVETELLFADADDPDDLEFVADATGSTYSTTTGLQRDWLTSLRTTLNGSWIESQIAAGIAVEASRATATDIISADMIRIPDMDVRLSGTTNSLDLVDIRVSNLLHGDESFEDPTLTFRAVEARLPDPRAEANDNHADFGDHIGYLGFEQYWDTRLEDPDPYDGLSSSQYMAPSGNTPYDIQRRIIWRIPGELYEALKTPVPAVRIGPGCASSNVAIYGPQGGLVGGEDFEWQAWSPAGVHLWTDTQTGGTSVTIAGTPLLIGEEIYTFAKVDDTNTLFVHNLAGTMLARLETDMPEIIEAVFSGVDFRSTTTVDTLVQP